MAAWDKDLDPKPAGKRPAWEADLDKPAAPVAAPAAQPAPVSYNPTDGMSTFEKLAAGAGKSVVDTGRGLGQLLRQGIEAVAPPTKSLSDLVTNGRGKSFADTLGLPTQADIDEAARLDKPLMETGAGMVGNVGGQIAQMAVPGAALGRTALAGRAGAAAASAAPRLAAVMANPIVRSAASAGAFSATQPVLTGDTRAGNTATGALFGAGGQVVGNAIGAVARGASSAIAPEVRALAAKAEAAGIPVNMAQLSDSKFLKTLASTLDRLPFTGAQASRDAQQQGFNRAVSRTFGEDAPRVTSDVYASAKTRIGKEFERLAAQNNLDANNPQLLNSLSTIADEARRFGTDDTARAVSNAVDELLGKADASGLVPGRAYQSLDSKLGSLMKSGGEKAYYLGNLRDAVRTAMDSSISAADQAAWQQARGQYRNLKTVRDLVAKEGVEGNISPALLRGRVLASNAGKESAASGRGGDMADLASIGYRFVRDPIPDSGTAGRLAVLGALGGGGYAVGADPTTVLATVAGGATAGRGLNAIINSRAGREYLLNGIQTPIARRLLEGSAGVSPMLLPAVSNALQQ